MPSSCTPYMYEYRFHKTQVTLNLYFWKMNEEVFEGDVEPHTKRPVFSRVEWGIRFDERLPMFLLVCRAFGWARPKRRDEPRKCMFNWCECSFGWVHHFSQSKMIPEEIFLYVRSTVIVLMQTKILSMYSCI